MFHSKSDDDIPVAAATVVDAGPLLATGVAADPPLANTIEYEAIPKLLFVDMQQEDDEKVAAAVTKLAGLLNKSNANWKVNAVQALSLGAIAIILLVMRKWHCNRSIQFHGFLVLAWFGCYAAAELNGPYPTTSGVLQSYHGYIKTIHHHAGARATAFAVSIFKSGGIETIMAAMKSFPDDAGIQAGGCNAIGNAFCWPNPTTDEAMARFVHKLNGIELVVLVMKKFQNNASVQQMGCCVLRQLSRIEALRDALKKRGALSAVGEATEKHDDNDVQVCATAFFKNMF